jgi:tRNA dimethylallyltransferase
LPSFQKHKFILDPGQERLDHLIAGRTEVLLASGWKEEVKEILAQGVPRTAPAFRAIGYDYVIDLIEGRLGEEEAKDRIVTSTRQYAKRQRTWLRAEPNARTLDHQSAKKATEEICNAMLSR